MLIIYCAPKGASGLMDAAWSISISPLNGAKNDSPKSSVAFQTRSFEDWETNQIVAKLVSSAAINSSTWSFVKFSIMPVRITLP